MTLGCRPIPNIPLEQCLVPSSHKTEFKENRKHSATLTWRSGSQAAPQPQPDRLPSQPNRQEYCGCKLQNFPENLVHQLPLETSSCLSGYFPETKISQFVMLGGPHAHRRPGLASAEGHTGLQAPEAAPGGQPVTVSGNSPPGRQGKGGKHRSQVGYPGHPRSARPCLDLDALHGLLDAVQKVLVTGVLLGAHVGERAHVGIEVLLTYGLLEEEVA